MPSGLSGSMAAIISYLALMILGVRLIVANTQYHHLFLNPQKQQVCNNTCFLPTVYIDFP